MSGRPATKAVIPGRAALSVGHPKTPAPKGWAWTSLYDVAELGTGHTPSRKQPNYWNGEIPWIGIRDAAKYHGSRISDTAQHITHQGLANSAARLLPAGTVCLSRTASVGYVVQMARDMATSQDFVTWTCNEGLAPRFLMYALLAEGDDIRRFGKGSTHTTIYFPEVKAFHICLAPISEQRRIAAKLDNLFERTRLARAELSDIPHLIDSYKKAILKATFDDATECSGAMTTLGDIASEVRNGLSKKPHDIPPGTPILRISSVRSLAVHLDDRRYYPVTEEIADNVYLRNGDLLFTRYNGNPDLVAVCGRVRGLSEALVYPDKLIRVRICNEEISEDYVEIICAADQSRQWLTPYIKTAAGQHGISGKDLKKLPFPLPNFQDQDRIVSAAQQAMRTIGNVAVELQHATHLLDRLEQANLTKAFHGELVPQDPNDEPATVLLERIRAERVTQHSTPRRGHRGTRTTPQEAVG